MLGHSIGSGNTLQLKRPWLECPQALFEPTLITRLRARGRRLELDRALAEGADPSSSPLLAARAGQLVRSSSRNRLASALERLALTADAPPTRFGAVPRRRALRANRFALMDLAGTLRKGGVLYARGIAMLELVLIDGTGPAYTDARGEGLARELELAGASLGG
ncbi:MAG TPA: hypothetical protein VHW96_00420 [Solirubrobacteraceae bacterium]|jgi:hypothetical protein|nr:hypothetical protein [Solirubrobacteraceae bacterium]